MVITKYGPMGCQDSTIESAAGRVANIKRASKSTRPSIIIMHFTILATLVLGAGVALGFPRPETSCSDSNLPAAPVSTASIPPATVSGQVYISFARRA
ncbi:hypothetical protein B0H11DRAFT_2121347 [Mycena galericulata]|nr:hypothetical protein B0H11DRAFT_2121347 [Mycena galericulata]